MALRYKKKNEVQDCQLCGISFRPSFSGRQKFCNCCRDVVNSNRQKIKKQDSLKTGYLFGRPIKHLIYERYMKSAVKRAIPFHLSIDEFTSYWQKPCYYCSSAITTIGLDRYNSELGYVSGNIVPCCTECNLMKRKLHGSIFIDLCRKISDNFKTTLV